MTSPRKPGFLLPVAVTLTVLLGLYVGAYYATVVADAGETRLEPFYSVLGYTLPVEAFFAPIHGLDRRIRSDVWDGSRWKWDM